MLHRSERILDNIPVGSLGIIAVDGCEEMGNKVNDYLVKWRKEETRFQKDNLVFNGYEKPNYLINAKVPRFGSGEAKGIINESVRGKDLYLMVDVCNYSLTYSLSGYQPYVTGRPFPEPEACHRRCRRKSTSSERHYAFPV